jgi:predicted RNA-binding Zn-ribbon protein involved in translation (DUF1610 family)
VIRLPVGLAGAGRHRRRARLRPWRGAERRRVLDIDFGQPREALLSQALSLAVASVGDIVDPPPAVFHRLPLCDRHALVRGLLVEEGVREVTVAPLCATCNRHIELALEVTAIRLPEPGRQRIVIERRRRGGLERRELSLPCAADAEAAASGDHLLAACLGLSLRRARPWLETADGALAAVDPLAEVEITGTCPDCGAPLAAAYDLVAGWLTALRQRARALLEEIHLLALRYHWSEAQILRLPASRRKAYLDLCWSAAPDTVEAHA